VIPDASEELVMRPIPIPSLSDGQVSLRPWRSEDVPAMLSAFADPVFDHFSDWAPQTDVDALAHLARQDDRRRRGEAIDLAITSLGEPGAALGGVSLNDIDLREHSRASIGYWLGPEGRGRGLATRSVMLLASWAFAELGLSRLELTCAPENLASQRVAERCGFQREGLLRSHMAFKGGRRDSLVYSLLP
jgi:RimJ/RimL family protein N-acetyltransferase